MPELFEALVFESAAVYDSPTRSRIELPAPLFYPGQPVKKPLHEHKYRLEIITGKVGPDEGQQLGFIEPEHVLLIVSPDDYWSLCDRVASIAKKPLKFELEADDSGQIQKVLVDGKPLLLRRSEVVGGQLDLEIEDSAPGVGRAG